MYVHGWPLFFFMAIYFYMTLGLSKAFDFYIDSWILYPCLISISRYKRQSLAR